MVRVGRTLRDKWHLDALIDVGGMAAVYAATHRNGMRGAVKILHRHRSLDPDIAARFRREGYIANKVAHPNAVRVLDDDVDDDGSVFLVMELLEGATLWERAAAGGGHLPPDEVLLAVDQLLDVLAVAHEAAIVHRDVKPENVFVTAEGQVKILDFGIARLYEPGASRALGDGGRAADGVAGLHVAGASARALGPGRRAERRLVGGSDDVHAPHGSRRARRGDRARAPRGDLPGAGPLAGDGAAGRSCRARRPRRSRPAATARGPVAGCALDADGGPGGVPGDVRRCRFPTDRE